MYIPKPPFFVPYSKDIDHYYHHVYQALCGTVRAKREFFKSWKEEVEGFLQENPGCSLETLMNQYGTPGDVAESFRESFPDEAEKIAKLKKRVFLLLVGVGIFIILFVGLFFIREAAKNDNYRNGEFVETVGQGELPPLDSSMEGQAY